MKPILPREMLWTDKKTLKEFFELDSVNDLFYTLLKQLSDDYFSVEEDALAVYNEVYYMLTRIAYENPKDYEIGKYAFEIKESLGWSYSATLVMSMVYFLAEMDRTTALNINKPFMKMVRKTFGGPMYWLRFKEGAAILKKYKYSATYDVHPQPYPVSYFKTNDIDWKTVTRDYNLDCIKQVVDLWEDEEDKCEIGEMIADSMEAEAKGHHVAYYTYEPTLFPMAREDFMPYERKRFPIKPPQTNESYEHIREENHQLSIRIEELEQAIAAMNAANERGLKDDNTRRFTLLELVNYCNECDDWEDAKLLKSILYNLLEGNGTQDEYRLINSIKRRPEKPQIGAVHIEEARFEGSMYDITGNQSVNIGGAENGKQGN